MMQEVATEDMGSPTMRTPAFVAQTVDLIRSLLQIFDQQVLLTSKSPNQSDERIREFNDTLDRTFLPVINICRQVAARLNASRAAVFTINSYSYMLASLSSPPELREWFPCYNTLEMLLQDASAALVKTQVEFSLEKLGE